MIETRAETVNERPVLDRTQKRSNDRNWVLLLSSHQLMLRNQVRDQRAVGTRLAPLQLILDRQFDLLEAQQPPFVGAPPTGLSVDLGFEALVDHAQTKAMSAHYVSPFGGRGVSGRVGKLVAIDQIAATPAAVNSVEVNSDSIVCAAFIEPARRRSHDSRGEPPCAGTGGPG